MYRLGHKGNVDLKYIQPASGGFYYRDHMPVLGKKEEQQPVAAPTRSTFTVGDRVKVCLDRKALITLQQGHGGWNPRMAEYLNRVGCVHRITDKGDIRYDDSVQKHTHYFEAIFYKFIFFHLQSSIRELPESMDISSGCFGESVYVSSW